MNDIINIPLDQIVEVENYRTVYPQDHIQGIADSILASGFKTEFAITVYPLRIEADKQIYAINTGHCRTRAAKIAGIEAIPAIVKENNPVSLVLDQLGENENRRDPNDIDRANGYQRALDRGATLEQLSKATGKTRDYINRRLILLALVPDVQELVAKGHMGIQFACLLKGLDSNFQRLAVKQYRDMKGPTIDEFGQVVNQLLEKQNTLSLFDLSLFNGKPDELILSELKIERKKSRDELEAELAAEREMRQRDREYAKAKYLVAQQEIARLKAELYEKGMKAA